MSDLSLFSSDEDLAREQQSSRRHVDRHLSEPERAKVAIADAREERLHRRLRAFAWWLFVLPVLIWVVGVVVLYLAGSVLGFGRP
jgi:hypothetical protein